MKNGLMACEFWIGAIGIGFVIPIIFCFFRVIPKLVYPVEMTLPRIVEALMPIAVFTGASMLLYVLLFGGQITGPVGI
jgi:formate-dependent nitrite reductase membrane component NrfD